MHKKLITAIVLTKNEEGILDRCLSALSFVHSIIVFDSFSTDGTLEIAKNHRAIIYQRDFDNYACQRNAALDTVPNECDWVFMVDADEIVTAELREEILNEIELEQENSMYRVRRKDFYQGKWIKHSSGYPTWFPRLFKNGKVRVAREINEEYLTDGKVGHLNEHLLHYPFNKGITWWMDKHNRYSQMEAKLMLKEIKEPLKFRNLFSKDPVARRKQQKRLSYHLPLRPQIVFFAFYFLKAGFLDGKAGFNFCRLRQMYEYMISIKFEELKEIERRV